VITVKWRRFARSFPRWTTALLAGLIALQCIFWWEWLARELPPLQRYYLPTYFHSAKDAKRPGSKTRIEPLFKTAPGRKQQLISAGLSPSRADCGLMWMFPNGYRAYSEEQPGI
jgi:hypothetical protein